MSNEPEETPRYPLRRAGLTVRDIGGEAMIYGAAQQSIHILNPTARLIWERCDGTHDVDALVRALRDAFDIAASDDLAADVRRTLQTFAAKGLLA